MGVGTSRVLEPLRLNANPLVFALGQVVIPPVLRVADLVPDVQEGFRKAGFPRYAQMETRQVRLVGSKPDDVEVVPDTRWIFADRDNRKGVVLSAQFMVLEQTTYDTFEDFTATLARAVEVLGDVMDIEFCQRFGFRRVNLISSGPEADLPLRHFLREGLRGLDPERLEVERLDATLEERAKTPEGNLIVRLIKPPPESGLPNDLAPTTLERTAVPANAESMLLDIDHYTATTAAFDPDAVIEGFWRLHYHSDLAFRRAVTDEALQYWREGATG